MCGICCLIVQQDGNSKELQEYLFPLLCHRGPDQFKSLEETIHCSNAEETVHCTFAGTVLHLRGDVITPQPLKDEQGNILIWNGEIFGGIQVEDNQNDTQVLLEMLGKNGSDHSSILRTMSRIKGPWAFLYWQAETKLLWFGRDYFGRRSLLWHLPCCHGDVFALSSVANRHTCHLGKEINWEEVPAGGLYCLSLQQCLSAFNGDEDSFSNKYLKHYPWKSVDSPDAHELICPVTPFNRLLPSDEDLEPLATSEAPKNSVPISSGLIGHLTKTAAVETSEQNISTQVLPRQSLAGAQDSVSTFCTTKGSTENARKSSHNGTYDQNPIDSGITSGITSSVINDSAKHVVSTTAYNRKLGENTQFPVLDQNYSVNTSSCNGLVHKVEELTLSNKTQHHNTASSSLPHKLLEILGEAVRKRVTNLPREKGVVCPDSDEGGQKMRPMKKTSHVGILFSGGIDSIVIAALADRYVPANESIDLINVAFEQHVKENVNPSNKNKRNKKPRNTSTSIKTNSMICPFDVPDRLTGRSGVSELCTINPDRQWNFIEVNVTLDELTHWRGERIAHLVYPLTSVLDDSIGCALWFAARGQGQVQSHSPRVEDSAHGDQTSECERGNFVMDSDQDEKRGRNAERDHTSQRNHLNVEELSEGVHGHQICNAGNFVVDSKELETTLNQDEKNVQKPQKGIINLAELSEDNDITSFNTTVQSLVSQSCSSNISKPTENTKCEVSVETLHDTGAQRRLVNYTCSCKVLLVGMGADEQLGGYARHRSKFFQEGWQGLLDEMEIEVRRISKRNLGRDDRCISDHGREARFPFLDESVVSFLNSLPVWKKTDPRMPRGFGEKILLRKAARLLGLTSSAGLPKRAIQFGSRIAKMEKSGEKGSDSCERLK